MRLDTQVSNRCTGKDFHGDGKHCLSVPFFSMTCIPFSDLFSLLSISLLVTERTLQKLPNSQNPFIYKQRMLLNHQLPIY